ncbi:MAG: class I SAM-dependent methyltransferase [Lachnospiraceae bacterium]|nr:class I SAM-dependent methyltransferase [Lachnospiraceae bacterium]
MSWQEAFEIYGGFAEVYDKFMDNVSYDEWYAYLHKLLSGCGISEGTVAELACGTGEITKRLYASGYQVIGLDLSEDMLTIAREKCADEVLLLYQDMRELELLEPVDAFVCAGDGINYLDSLKEFEQVAKRVSAFLKKDGAFIFDLKTDYYFREIVGNRTITDNREDASYIWENSYDEERMRNEYLLTVYELVDDEKDLFVRSDEIHYQQVFSADDIKDVLEKNGFAVEHIYEAFSEHEPTGAAERIYVVARQG